MTKTERIIEYMHGMSNTDLAYTMANVCYMYNFYNDRWQEMGDFDEVMEGVLPSYVAELVIKAGKDFDPTDEFVITDGISYLYSDNAEGVGQEIRNNIPEYASIIMAYGVWNTGDSGLDSILERGED